MTTETIDTLLRDCNDTTEITAIREEVEIYGRSDNLAYVDSTNPDVGRIAVTDEDGCHLGVEAALARIDAHLARA